MHQGRSALLNKAGAGTTVVGSVGSRWVMKAVLIFAAAFAIGWTSGTRCNLRWVYTSLISGNISRIRPDIRYIFFLLGSLPDCLAGAPEFSLQLIA